MPVSLHVPTHTCPACAPDGGYGHAEVGREYRCPACTAVWMPEPDRPAARTRVGQVWQRIKVFGTSRR